MLAHIDANLDGDLGVERLAAEAAYSPCHFHRQFAAYFGLGVAAYVQRLRLRRAGEQLAFRADLPVTEIALGAGYSSPDAFARAFRRLSGQSPSGFRAQPAWEAWERAIEPLDSLRRTHMAFDPASAVVHIVNFPATPVALLPHRGDPRRVGETVRRFIAWRRENGLPPAQSATFNVFHDDPRTVDPAAFRMDLCAATARAIAPNAAGVVAGLIPAGRCAVLRFVGDDANLEAAATWLYAHWLPASGEEPRDFPFFLQRVRFFPDVPAHEAVCDLHLPLR